MTANPKRMKELSKILGGYMEQEALEAAYELYEAAEEIELSRLNNTSKKEKKDA